MTSEVCSKTIDRVRNSINKKLIGQSSHISSNQCIFKVPNELRSVNEKAYEPQMIAIGPYHHGKPHLIAMEEHKIRYLQSFLQRRNENDASRYVQIIGELEENTRRCYAETLDLTEEAFVEMMLLDGCFIIEFIWKFFETPVQDPLFGSIHMWNRLMLDLLLLENQLPFFILWKLLVASNSNVIPDPAESHFIKLTLLAYKMFLPGPVYGPDRIPLYSREEIMQIKSLLGLLHDHRKPSPERMDAYLEGRENIKRFTRCATELQESGIKFESLEGCNLFDIKFEKGIIKIPKIKIEDRTECVLRNLIAYEQLTSSRSPYFTDYMVFIDSLIDSAKDVEILCCQGIIENWKGDDDTIAILLNKIGEQVFCDRALYADIQKNVDKHCKRQWNQWMAKLRHDYFNGPWALISVSAAAILFLLTGTQTVYSVLSYYK
ncbi:hypothetical protein P3X46_034445 [Hevea brasiliensis]|uniref:Uncharacterized protein n=2 Tax=Hevea brasiliensis TaxID=3981 RepID=A0ABQ9K8D0_HEVBR|nr:hypothetical protein P3X46_034445 [Hevea brasiliensis]